jgi:hypothetical protein
MVFLWEMKRTEANQMVERVLGQELARVWISQEHAGKNNNTIIAEPPRQYLPRSQALQATTVNISRREFAKGGWP